MERKEQIYTIYNNNESQQGFYDMLQEKKSLNSENMIYRENRCFSF